MGDMYDSAVSNSAQPVFQEEKDAQRTLPLKIRIPLSCYFVLGAFISGLLLSLMFGNSLPNVIPSGWMWPEWWAMVLVGWMFTLIAVGIL